MLTNLLGMLDDHPAEVADKNAWQGNRDCATLTERETKIAVDCLHQLGWTEQKKREVAALERKLVSSLNAVAGRN